MFPNANNNNSSRPSSARRAMSPDAEKLSGNGAAASRRHGTNLKPANAYEELVNRNLILETDVAALEVELAAVKTEAAEVGHMCAYIILRHFFPLITIFFLPLSDFIN